MEEKQTGCRGIFVTATGTDVGKTYATALLVKKLRKAGENAGYYKAALSGAEWQDGTLIGGDAQFVAQTAGIPLPPNEMVSYLYETAVSPHLAAEREGRPIELSIIQADFERMKQQFSYLTVEGSGGIVCPLRLDDQTLLLTDVIRALGLDVLLVASAALGTINSTVLTVEYAKAHGIGVRGILLNRWEEDNFLHQDNKKQIEALTGVPVVACVKENETDLDLDVAELYALYRDL